MCRGVTRYPGAVGTRPPPTDFHPGPCPGSQSVPASSLGRRSQPGSGVPHLLVGIAREVLFRPADVKYCPIKPLPIPTPQNAPSNGLRFPVSITLTPKGFFLATTYCYAFLVDSKEIFRYPATQNAGFYPAVFLILSDFAIMPCQRRI